MAARSLLSHCGSRTCRVLSLTAILCLVTLAYWLDIWTVSLETHNVNGTKRLHIVTKLNWSAGREDTADSHKVPAPRSSKDQVDRLLSGFGVNNGVNVGEGGEVVTDNILPNISPFSNSHNNKKNTLSTSNLHNYTSTGSDSTPKVQHKLDINPTSQDVLVRDFIPNVRITNVNCVKLMEGDTSEIAKAEEYQRKHPKANLPPAYFTAKAKDCEAFKQNRRYTRNALSGEEEKFPIAYSLVIFKDIEQVERLLRAVYRPQNYYCVHVDAKASAVFREAVMAIVKCFDNVFVASHSVDVQWGWYSVLEPEIVCMEDLWRFKKWKYFINLTGQEFPLKTNEDIVRILKAMNGANNAEGTVKRRNRDRVEYVHQGINTDRKVKKPPPPVPVTLTKGSLHVVVQRGFVDFVLHNKQGLEFRNWVKDTGVPDETFFTSLIYSPQLKVPGAYKGEPETDHMDQSKPRNPFFARFKNWGDSVFNWPCHGTRVRMICVFGVGDLPLLSTRKELFANKFHQTYHPLAYDCLEELHYNRTRDSVLGKRDFDASFYSALDIVKNHVT